MNRIFMYTVGLFEAKQKLSELVSRASSGEEIGITRHGKLVARLAAPKPQSSWREYFGQLEAWRKSVELLKDPPVKEWIEEGRA